MGKIADGSGDGLPKAIREALEVADRAGLGELGQNQQQQEWREAATTVPITVVRTFRFDLLTGQREFDEPLPPNLPPEFEQVEEEIWRRTYQQWKALTGGSQWNAGMEAQTDQIKERMWKAIQARLGQRCNDPKCTACNPPQPSPFDGDARTIAEGKQRESDQETRSRLDSLAGRINEIESWIKQQEKARSMAIAIAEEELERGKWWQRIWHWLRLICPFC
jgi:hypothetical protein